METEEEGEE
jgi:hypothetical protein